jgi:hypothetical protein
MGSLLEAYAAGMVNTGDIDTAIGRILLQRFRTGLFDPIEDQPYMKYGAQDVNSTDAHALVLDGALQGLVRLRRIEDQRGFGFWQLSCFDFCRGGGLWVLGKFLYGDHPRHRLVACALLGRASLDNARWTVRRVP